MFAPRCLVLVLAVALFALPAAARAATVSSDGTTITYAAEPGHDDAIKVEAGPKITAMPEGTATLTAGPGVYAARRELGDVRRRPRRRCARGRQRHLRRRHPGFPATVDGGPGADLLTGETGADSLTGGPGVDVLTGVAAAPTSCSRSTGRPTASRVAPAGGRRSSIRPTR